MSVRRLALPLHALLIVILSALASLAAESRREIIINENADYFGFDLRTETDVSLDACKNACIKDRACRAFTYNAKARWCFLKSDFGELKPFSGSIAGRVVEASDEPDLGAAPDLAFAGSYIEEARQYRNNIVAGAPKDASARATADAATATEQSGDARQAFGQFGLAAGLSPDQSQLWAGIARSALKVTPAQSEAYTLQQAATAAALTAYQTSRTALERAEALNLLGQALDRRQDGRPAIEALKASLELVGSQAVQALYASARTRYGFRVIGNTIDADAATPRACVQFSEDLTDADYEAFVRLDNAAPEALTVNQRELCIDGLKHGGRYRLTMRAGLPSAIGETLEQPATLNLFVRDRAASLRFTGENFVLPGTARRGIPVISVNVEKANIEIFRVGERALARLLDDSQFLSQLDFYAIERIRDGIGEPVWKGELAIKSALNEDIVTSIPVDDALPQRKPGIYVIVAKPESDRSESWDPQATQWFVVSDIGLATFAGEDGLNVFARSLATARPLANVALKLLAKNNEVLGETVTDAQGRATFVAGLTRGTAGLAPAVISASNGTDDFVFLDMTRAGFDLSDRGVTGRPAAGTLDVYAWTDRGIYRAGETIHATAITRDAAARAVADLPLVFVLTRPDGVEDRRIASAGAEAGGHALDFDLQPNAQRGAWTMRVYTDPKQEPLAEKTILVEDFVLDRIEFDLSAESAMVVGEPLPVNVAGRFLYGAPAAGLSLEGELVVTPTQSWKTFPGYVFGLADEEKSEAEVRVPLEELPVLDDDGKATFDVMLDEAPDTTQLLAGNITIRMRENGGRAVERSLAVDVVPLADMIGIKPEFADGQVAEGGTAKFRVLAANPAGERIDLADLNWTIVKITQNYQWYRDGSGWRYEPVEYTTKIAGGTINAGAADDATIAAPVTWGRFRLEVNAPEGDGAISSIEFNAGYYVAASSTETPDGLEIALDKARYAPGETAQLKISPRFAGQALIAIGAERLYTTLSADVPEAGTTVDIPVSADWGAGTYVTVTLFRPGEAQASRMPMRAIGVKWLSIDPGARDLAVSIEVPEKIEPNTTLSIPVAVSGASVGMKTYVTLAAIDVGILNLTGYEPPAPDDWYFGQRRLGIEIRDLYGRLIDGSAGELGRLRTGGDGIMMTSKGSPPTEKLLALYSGIVELDDRGHANIEFDIPQFNGTARLMAVAWNADAVGHAVQDVVIRDPVVITASTPRFMALGDTIALLVEFANTDGPAGEYQLDLETSDELEASPPPATIALAQGAREQLVVPLSAVAIGTGGITLHLKHASGLELEINRLIPVRSDTLPVASQMQLQIGGNGGALTINRELLAASRLDDASISIGISPDSAFDIPSLLLSLDRYPYGCAEQTTSRALPLLYVSELSRAAGLEEDTSLKERIEGAIARVLNYQSASGSFGLWGPGGGDLWLDAYVTDFLTRARELQYDVPERAMLQAVENLQNTLAYQNDVASQSSEIAYALYVLARNRRASLSDLRYYAESQIETFSSPMARAQLGASLALYGDQQGAERAFASAFRLAKSAPEASRLRSDYGSPLRDSAAMLALAAETKPEIASLRDMVPYVAALRSKARWTSTQDQAWMLLAARALSTDRETIELDINGQAHKGSFSRRVEGGDIAIAPLTITNKGSEAIQATITTIASPLQSLPAGGDGFTIERRYYTLDGNEANITQVKQNERFVVVLKIGELNAWPSRVLVTDLLPAGFEIDNPRIVSSAELPNFGWLGAVDYAHSEYRDDRFVAAFNRTANDNRDFSFAYVVRAVTPGVFAVPAASVEDMYRPQFSARTATGRMEISAN